MSVFEINIRFLESLLTSFALTGNKMFREKALQIGERMLPAFETKTEKPNSLINFYTGRSRNHGWASSGCVYILSEISTIHLKFFCLGDITSNPIFGRKLNNEAEIMVGPAVAVYILSENVSIHLEFSCSGDITGNPIFGKKVEQVRRVLKDLDKPKGLYPNFIRPKTGK
ncbi:hypothetical protein HCN44_001682 [Aphidius gifuensis]|uniref:Uncharacterized protein n=1 Tax=Aphidius gifuensis TaxID=684658 RepID=A0A835CQK6_APHGI|nr:hypothetical protein HCN44_001682 [Aphidius gifuensis]